MAAKNLRFSMESLEKREMMAGDVVAAVNASGDLFIGEAIGHYQTANAVEVSRLVGGMIRVTGIQNLDGTVTKVNGAAFQVFSPTGDLNVNLGAGNDKVVLASGVQFKNVTLNMDQVGGPADADQVFVNRVNTTGKFTVRTGAGADFVAFNNSVIGNDATDSASINTGSGVDSVRFDNWVDFRGNAFIQTYDSALENEADYVDLNTGLVRGTLSVNTGGGNDRVNVTGLTAGGNIVLNTDKGDDIVNVREVQAMRDFYAFLGDGADTLDMTYCRANKMQLDGGTGTDKLLRYLDGPVNSYSATGFEPISSFTGSVGGSGSFKGVALAR